MDKIIEAAELQSFDSILEIGPGTGNLTGELLKKGKQVIAVEYDKAMILELNNLFPREITARRLELIQADFAKWAIPQFDVCVANIPYQISSAVIGKLIAHPFPFRSAVLLVQEEFARRLIAKPGANDYSRLSVSTSVFAHVDFIIRVARHNFYPPPKVNSSVVRIIPRQIALDISEFDSLLRICFHRKKRTLRKCFMARAIQEHMSLDGVKSHPLLRDSVINVLRKNNFDELRAFHVTPLQFKEMYQTFADAGIRFLPAK